jgi:hypothetical protein
LWRRKNTLTLIVPAVISRRCSSSKHHPSSHQHRLRSETGQARAPCRFDTSIAVSTPFLCSSTIRWVLLQPANRLQRPASISFSILHRAHCNGISTPTPASGRKPQVLDGICLCFVYCGCAPLPPRIPRPHPRSKCPPENRLRRSTAAQAKGAHAANRSPYEDVGARSPRQDSHGARLLLTWTSPHRHSATPHDQEHAN